MYAELQILVIIFVQLNAAKLFRHHCWVKVASVFWSTDNDLRWPPTEFL